MLDYSVVFAGIALEILVAWRIFRGRMWRPYPWFCIYYSSGVLLVTVLLFPLYVWSSGAFRIVYWIQAPLARVLGFSVLWEIFRNAFPKKSTIYPIASKGLAGALYATAMVVFLINRGIPGDGELYSFFPETIRQLSLVHAGLLLSILLGVIYYSVPLGRNIWGIAIGFGAYVSFETANFAAVELHLTPWAYFRLLGPISFVGCLVVWAWALWTYSPNPALPRMGTAEAELALPPLRKAWSSAMATLRKAFLR